MRTARTQRSAEPSELWHDRIIQADTLPTRYKFDNQGLGSIATTFVGVASSYAETYYAAVKGTTDAHCAALGTCEAIGEHAPEERKKENLMAHTEEIIQYY